MEARSESAENNIRAGIPLLITTILGFVILMMANIAGAGYFRWQYAIFFTVVLLLAAIASYLYLERSRISTDKGFLFTLGAFAGLVALGALSLLWVDSLYDGLHGFLLTGSFLLAFILGFLLLRRWEELYMFMGLVVAAAVSLCVYGLLQYFYFFNDIIEFMGSHGLDYTITNRVNSRFTSPNWFASFLVIAIPITVALLLLEKRRILAWVWGAALALQLTCLYLTQSRGGWAVLLMIAVALAILVPGRRWKQGWKVLAVALLLALALSLLCSAFDPLDKDNRDASAVTTRAGADYSGIDASSAAASVSSRFRIFRTGIDMFTDNLAGGVGIGNYPTSVQHYQYESYYAEHAGNYVLETASEGGIFGLILIVALSLLVLFRVRAVRRLVPEDSMRTAGAALWIAAVGFLAHNLLDTSWYNALAGVVCWLCAGAMFAVSTPTRGDEQDDGDQPGVKSERSGATVAGLAVITLAVVLASGYVLALFFLAATEKESGDYQNRYGDRAVAVQDYLDSLGYLETNPEVHRLLGSIYLDLFNSSEKLEGFEYSDKSMAHLDRAIELEQQDAFGHLSKGLLLLNLEQGDSGRASLEEAQRLYPNSPAAYYFEAESYFAEEAYDIAVEKYLDTLKLLPYYLNQSISPFQEGPEEKYFLMSVQRMVEILIRQGNLEEALKVVDDYLSDLPGSDWLHYLRAQVLERMGEWSQALDEYEKVMRLEPDAIGIYLKMGRIYKQQGDPEKAREMFEKELDLNPQYHEAQDELDALTESAPAGSE